jgi:hypothetical protein
MAIDLIPKSLYPLVPQALGVPPLLRSGAQILDTITLGYLGIGKALDSIIGQEPVKWAVLDPNGKFIADYDSVLAVSYQNGSRISDYPVEQGQFASYNKVEDPFDITVTLTCGGSEERRALFLANCEAARKTINAYTIITPETTYENINFTAMSFSRTSQDGATLLTVQLQGREIRNTAQATFSQPKSDAGYDLQDLGAVQPVTDPNFDASGVV